MIFDWDEEKRQLNKVKHEVDFVDIRILFDGRPVITTPSKYPHEPRLVTTGQVADKFYSVVWTIRNEKIRLISARRARDAEKRAYRAVHDG